LGSKEWDVEKEFIFKDGGIIIAAHPDLIHKKTGVIGEIKTSTKMIKQPCPNNINQLKSYITILSALGYNVPYGKLLYIVLSANPEEYFVEFTVIVSEQEKKVILEKLIGDAAELEYGIDSRNAALVKHSMMDRNFYGYGGVNYLCQSCPFIKTCLRFQKENQEIDDGEELYYQLLFGEKKTPTAGGC